MWKSFSVTPSDFFLQTPRICITDTTPIERSGAAATQLHSENTLIQLDTFVPNLGVFDIVG